MMLHYNERLCTGVWSICKLYGSAWEFNTNTVCITSYRFLSISVSETMVCVILLPKQISWVGRHTTTAVDTRT
jgi:hypothetical protein